MINLWNRFGLLILLSTGLLLFVIGWGLGELSRRIAHNEMPLPLSMERAQDAVMAAASESASRARELTKFDWPSECAPATANAVIDLDLQPCKDALDHATSYPTLLRQAIVALRALKLTRQSVYQDAFASSVDEAAAPWQLFAGGRLLAPLHQRSDLMKTYRRASFVTPTAPLDGPELLELAARGIERSSAQADAARGFQTALERNISLQFSRVLQTVIGALVFFLLLGIGWQGVIRTTAWRRVAWSIALGLVVVAALVPSAFAAVAPSASAGNSGNSLGLIGDVFVRLVGLAARIAAGLLAPSAFAAALGFALIALAFFRPRPMPLLVTVYGLLMLPLLFPKGDWADVIAFSPFDPGALDASPILPLLVWFGEFTAVALGVWLAVGAWEVLGRAALHRATDLLDEAHAD